MIEKRPLWPRLKPHLTVFDGPLSLIIFLILSTGLVTLYSAGIDFPGRVEDQMRNILVSFIVMFIAANVPPQTLMRFAVPLYTVGIALLVAVMMFGLVKKGARRWLNLGMVVQPSELMKIAVPLMLAWFFQKREGMVRWQEFLVAGLLLVVPVGLIAKQPDLGTALLVLAAGFYVIFLAGLSWKILAGLSVVVAASLPVVWTMLHDYQRHRVLMLIDPSSDPLGKGFHIIQSTIAVGSGGISGKGWLKGTQAHLEFIPERTTDFIFAVYSEEFGLIGNIVLLLLYLALIGRGLIIAGNAPSFFTRLLAG
ncbi:MAG: rod shape-determining protein RodA, partial [Herminiimonas sp.]|nr:rod shape-determining protein RodA [Herminiimonas sp.]